MPCPRQPEPRGRLGTVPAGMTPRHGRESPACRALLRRARSLSAARSGGAADRIGEEGILTATASPTGESCRFGPKRGRADDQRRLLAA